MVYYTVGMYASTMSDTFHRRAVIKKLEYGQRGVNEAKMIKTLFLSKQTINEEIDMLLIENSYYK